MDKTPSTKNQNNSDITINPEAINKNKSPATIQHIKRYAPFIYGGLITMFIIFDYVVYTDVFHLHQANYFNYILPNILNMQFLIVFIFLPFIITIGILWNFKFQYYIFAHIDIDIFKKNTTDCKTLQKQSISFNLIKFTMVLIGILALEVSSYHCLAMFNTLYVHLIYIALIVICLIIKGTSKN